MLTFVFIVAVAIISGHNVGSGLATHGDSRDVIEKSVPAILRGSYYPSRSYGNPLYEYAAAVLFASGGMVLLSFYSLVLALASIFVFGQLLDRQVKGTARFLALAAFCFNPLFLINAFAVSEWMQVVFTLLGLLWFARTWLESSGAVPLAGLGLFSALLVLTRPDAALVCACLCAALIWQIGADRRRTLVLLGTLVITGLLTFSIFLLLNHGVAFLKTGILFSEAPYWRRLVIATVGVYSVFGPVAPVIVALAAVAVLRRWYVGGLNAADSFWARLFVMTVPVVFLRFVVLPDKLEYILYLLVLATLMLAYERLRLHWLALYALSLALPSVVTLSLFERVGITDHLSVHARLGPGAIAQDLRAIRYNWQLMHDPALLSRIGDAVYGGPEQARPKLHSQNWAAGLLSDSGDLVIGEPEAYHLDNPRGEPKNQRRRYADIYLCNRSVWVNGSFGWRLAEPALSWPTFDDKDGRLNLQCYKEKS
jgi:hypothetical protein